MVSLVAENRRLASPASLGGGVTAALQEDMLTYATPAAFKILTILENLEYILAIELLAAAQAYELQSPLRPSAERTTRLRKLIRDVIPPYADDRPMNSDIALMRELMKTIELPVQDRI
jgi:histidine ammonia-lyase